VVHAETRQKAIDKAIMAIDKYEINGVASILPFCKFAINHESFRRVNFNTHFVKDYLSDHSVLNTDESERDLAAIFGAKFYNDENAAPLPEKEAGSHTRSPWYYKRMG
jgi:propionyl-CoA carboxylase alpha chain